jgi:hypothetical protein
MPEYHPVKSTMKHSIRAEIQITFAGIRFVLMKVEFFFVNANCWLIEALPACGGQGLKPRELAAI